MSFDTRKKPSSPSALLKSNLISGRLALNTQLERRTKTNKHPKKYIFSLKRKVSNVLLNHGNADLLTHSLGLTTRILVVLRETDYII